MQPQQLSSKLRLSCSISGHIYPPLIMLTGEPRMIKLLWACHQILSRHMLFWCQFLDQQLSICHLNQTHINVSNLFVLFDLGMSTSFKPIDLETRSFILKFDIGQILLLMWTCLIDLLFLYHAPILERYVIRCDSEDGYQNDTCLNITGLRVQNTKRFQTQKST